MRSLKTIVSAGAVFFATGNIALAKPMLTSHGAPLDPCESRICGRILETPVYGAWATWKVPSYQGKIRAEVAQWVGVQWSDLCQAGIASTVIAPGKVQTSLIAQDWPAPFRAVVGPKAGDTIWAFAGKSKEGKTEAIVVDETTGQRLSVSCNNEQGAGWPMAEWMIEFNKGQPRLQGAGEWISQEWRD